VVARAPTRGAPTRKGHLVTNTVTDLVYEISCIGDRGKHDAVRRWFETRAASTWTRLPGLSALDIYKPAESGAHDPFVSDGPGPLLQAILQFPSAEALSRGIGDRAFAESLAHGVPDVAVTGTMFERRFYPVAGEDGPAPLRGPFSYVVRYHRPAEDEAAFVADYLAHHPLLLGKFPRIRAVICYLPIPAPEPGGLLAADYMLGNEVRFDTVDDFNAAMASPAREEARRHYRSLPPFTGRNTHYPMLRRPMSRQPA